MIESAGELERRSEAEKARSKGQMQKLQRARVQTKKNDENKFRNILVCCKEIISTAMDNGNDIFELLDPLISDNQCHLHSLLILNILLKCYNKNESRHYAGIEKLNERDKEILSHAVLFSLLKFEYRDELGFTLHQVSMDHFDGSILSSRNREAICISQAKKTFNSYSVEYIKSVASEKIKRIFNECTAVKPASQLTLLPYYATFSAVIDYIKRRKLPIILSLGIVNGQDIDGVTKYILKRIEVRYYEFRDEENNFFLKEDLSDYEREMPALTFGCYSITKNSTKGFQMDYDVSDCLMLFAAGHIQLPKNSKLPSGYKDGDEYARDVYEKDVDYFIKYNKHYERAKERNLIHARYSKIVRSSVEQGGDHYSFTVERRREENKSLLVHHAYLSNYSREYQRQKSSDCDCELDQQVVFQFSKKREISETLRRFIAMYQGGL